MRMQSTLTVMLLTMLLLPSVVRADEYFVAPAGAAENPGTVEEPWDIESAWSGEQDVAPGSTIYMKGGTYRHPVREWGDGNFHIRLAGDEDAPIHIRPIQGERATIDGGVIVDANSHHLWLWDLEITISEAAEWDRRVAEGGSHPRPDVDQPQGGLTIHGGEGSRFINLVIHTTNSTGVSFWRGASDAELHGCLIYNNGWMGPDRYHGPGIYTQNQHGEKWITDNILFGNYSTTIQAYGSDRAYVDGFRVIGNIAFAPVREGRRERILIGGGRPSQDIVANANILYEVPLQLGFNAPHNEDAVVRDNIVVNATLSINRFREVDERDNLVLTADDDRPDEPVRVVLRPNKYNRNRANLAVLNWGRTPTVAIDLSDFLNEGDRFRIVSSLDFFGDPVATDTFTGDKIEVPVSASEQTGNGEFCAYIVFRLP